MSFSNLAEIGNLFSESVNIINDDNNVLLPHCKYEFREGRRHSISESTDRINLNMNPLFHRQAKRLRQISSENPDSFNAKSDVTMEALSVLIKTELRSNISKIEDNISRFEEKMDSKFHDSLSKLNSIESQISDMSVRIKVVEEKQSNSEITINNIKEENQALKLEMGKIETILKNQQSFLEKMDAEKRKFNIVVNGILEKVDLGSATTDEDKCLHLFHKIGANDVTKNDYTINRLGDMEKAITDKKVRPILVTFKTADNKKLVLSKSTNLKKEPAPYDKIHIKRDTHTIVRKEWGRLYSVYNKEVENSPGHVITFDQKKRVIMRDGIIIDKWQANF